eukprot:CCRYP_002124-RA/>CCRYP_002124-RA protein AED:0.45 eAED:0.81 QI:0/0/0/1/0/0/2/0/96
MSRHPWDRALHETLIKHHHYLTLCYHYDRIVKDTTSDGYDFLAKREVWLAHREDIYTTNLTLDIGILKSMTDKFSSMHRHVFIHCVQLSRIYLNQE